MSYKWIAVTVLSIGFVFPPAHAEVIEPINVINQGKLAISDGSSIYILKKDKTFSSGPLGRSGRTIRGTWEQLGSNTFLIKGIWGWVNGLSKDSERTMKIYIGSLQDETEELQTTVRGHKIRKAYFLIESLDEGKANHSVERPAAR